MQLRMNAELELNDPIKGYKVRLSRERGLRQMAEEDIKSYRRLLLVEQELVVSRTAECEKERLQKVTALKQVEVGKQKLDKSMDEVAALQIKLADVRDVAESSAAHVLRLQMELEEKERLIKQGLLDIALEKEVYSTHIRDCGKEIPP